MDEPIGAEIRQTYLLFTLVSAVVVGFAVAWFGLWVFLSRDAANVGLLMVAVVIAPLIATMYVNRRGFVPTEVQAEEDQLVVRTPSAWWLHPEKQLRLRVESAERTDAGLVVTGALSRWWDWGRYKVRVEPEKADALEARLAEMVQG